MGLPFELDDADLCICGHMKSEHDGLDQCTQTHHPPPCGCTGFVLDEDAMDAVDGEWDL